MKIHLIFLIDLVCAHYCYCFDFSVLKFSQYHEDPYTNILELKKRKKMLQIKKKCNCL